MKRILLIFLLLSFVSNCGFKVVKRSQLANYDINEVITNGDKRINFKVKNKILFGSQKNGKKLISIRLNSKKDKTIKEKNIKNEITKYLINVNIDVEFKGINKKDWDRFNVSASGDYTVASQYSQTLNNEKNLTELLTDKLANEILNELGLRLNAN